MNFAARSSGGHVDCSILVPVLNEERYIRQSIASMRRQRFPGVLEFVFADGGSTDRTRELLAELAGEDSRIRVFDNPNRSVSSGLNVALRHSRGRWIARMDAHTEYPEDYVALGVHRLECGGTRWVSGPQIPIGDNAVSRAVALALGSFLGRGGSRKWGTAAADGAGEFELDTGVFTGVWERTTLLEYDGWDERWPRNSDSEMAARFLARGERLICLPAMGADYVPRGSVLGLWRQYLDNGEYREKTAASHPQSLRRSQLLAPALVLDCAVTVCGPRAVRSLARAGLACYVVAIASVGIQSLVRERRGDALIVPVVLSIMHFGHGLGFIRGIMRHGPPRAALAAAAGLDRVAAAWAPDPEPVFNPSLLSP